MNEEVSTSEEEEQKEVAYPRKKKGSANQWSSEDDANDKTLRTRHKEFDKQKFCAQKSSLARHDILLSDRMLVSKGDTMLETFVGCLLDKQIA